MELLLYILGMLIMAVAIGVSIALHEVGHLLPAKLFNVRVPQYMIGFGKTIFSFKKGETEYGFKAIPLGGYISMIGMYPPSKTEARQAAEHPEEALEHPGSTSPFASMAAAARAADAERMQPGDENRLFYKLPVLKRMVIMLGGPSMNLLLAIIFTVIAVVGFGSAKPTTTVGVVSECVPSVSVSDTALTYGECTDSSTASPAKSAGVQAGDRIVRVDSREVSSWAQISEAIRQHEGSQALSLSVLRNGNEQSFSIQPATIIRPVTDSNGDYARDAQGKLQLVEGGFIGISPTTALSPDPITRVPEVLGDQVSRMGKAMLSLPQRVWDVGVTLVTNGERDKESPMSVVGVSRVAGEVAATDKIDINAKAATLISLIASMNLMLFVFNLIPLLPLDGGHVAGALWESVRRAWAKLRSKPDPGPFDPVKMLPLTYVVAGAFVLMSLVLILADIFKPLTLF